MVPAEHLPRTITAKERQLYAEHGAIDKPLELTST